MNSSEIQKLINTVIKGQGDAIDVGGVLPDILGALSERMSGTAKVTVKIHSYKEESDEWIGDIDGVSGTLYVKGFDSFGNVIPEKAIPFVGQADASTIDVEFDAHIGDTIGVTAKIPGKGASCQLVTKVVSDCTAEPEVYPAGMYELGDGSLSSSPSGEGYNGLVIVTEDFAVLWPKHQSEGALEENRGWGPLFQNIPGVMVTEQDSEAIKDFDGALNTAAILSVISNESAAKFASKVPVPYYCIFCSFLPSAGMLKYLYDHKAEINAFIDAEMQEYGEKDYQKIPKNNVLSSTLYDDAVNAWHIDLSNGNVKWTYRNYTYYVCAVSAFQTLY